ncbi:MAG: hypothetical protein GX491_19130 [Chloroflexi bacterium]|nr:hypothetical protein [Chloroflexota bacterium]
MLYSILLPIHSILRWLIILAALLVIIRAANGLSFKRRWMKMDDRVAMWFTIFMDLQLLIGLLLYFVASPITAIALQNMSGAMGNPSIRFFAVEHTALMFIAVVVAHIGRSMVRKASDPATKHRRAIIWTAASILIVLAAIPWPFLEFGRPLIRFW